MNSNTQRATKQVMSQLHNNHIGGEKVRLLAHESMYWTGIMQTLKII